MARKSLRDMVGSVTPDVTAPDATSPVEVTPAVDATPAVDTAQVPDGSAEKPATAPQTIAQSGDLEPRRDVPLHEAHERKEGRFRADQLADLTTHARRLNRQRVDKSTPRVTENTLLRVAVDLLLSRVDDLSGDTEDALRRSIGI